MTLRNVTVDMVRRGATLAGALTKQVAGTNQVLSQSEISAFTAAHADPSSQLGAEEVGDLLEALYVRAKKSGHAPSVSAVHKVLATAVAEVANADANRSGKLSPAEQNKLSPLATKLLYFSHQFRHSDTSVLG